MSAILKSKDSIVSHLYVHIPFCHHICPYCGFYKHQPGKLANRRFVDALLAELDTYQREFDIAPRTIFFGGGTPTLLSPTHLDRLLDGLRTRLDLSGLEEWTLEANPATFDAAKARLLRQHGVNRISLGVQSWQPGTLKTLGRDHSAEEAEEGYELLREAGLPSIGIDLMFSVPQQSIEEWRADLEKTISLQPDHVSAYNLTYEEYTEFLRRHEEGELDTNEDRDAEMFDLGIATLEAAGYRHYEISNFSRPGHESLHNQAYWKGASFLGLGPGSVSTIGQRRWKALPDTGPWVERTLSGAPTTTEEETLDEQALRLEALALQLRTAEGVPEALVRNVPEADIDQRIESLIEESLLTRTGSGLLQLTPEGKALADPVAIRLA